MAENSRAYNSAWQLRADAWCRLEEAADRLTRPSTGGALKDTYVEICRGLLSDLTPLEPYWAYPGSPQFARVQRLFAAGSYEKFATTVTRINRALTTESYRSGDVENAGRDELDMFPADPRQLESQPRRARTPYFEVLVVEKMTDAQERALRNEVRKWRRPDDEFVYELVVVASGDEALIAARLNVNLQAVVIRAGSPTNRPGTCRRCRSSSMTGCPTNCRPLFARRACPDSGDLAGGAASRTRPVFDDRDRRGGHRRPAGPILPPGVPRPGRHARAAPVDPARRGRPLPHTVLQRAQAIQPPPTGVFHALPISQGKSIVNSHWIKDMVGFYGLEVFMAETSATCGGLDSLLEPTGPLRESQQLAAEA